MPDTLEDPPPTQIIEGVLSDLKPKREDIISGIPEADEEKEGSNKVLVEDIAQEGDLEEDKAEEIPKGGKIINEVQLITPPRITTQVQNPVWEITYQTPLAATTVLESTSSRQYDKFKTRRSEIATGTLHPTN